MRASRGDSIVAPWNPRAMDSQTTSDKESGTVRITINCSTSLLAAVVASVAITATPGALVVPQ